MTPNDPQNIRHEMREAAALARGLRDLAQSLDALAEASSQFYCYAPAAARGPILAALNAAMLDSEVMRIRCGYLRAVRAARAQLEGAAEAARALDIDHPARVALENAN